MVIVLSLLRANIPYRTDPCAWVIMLHDETEEPHILFPNPYLRGLNLRQKMATSNSSRPDEAQLPPYPSVEALVGGENHPRLTLDATQRLFWPLDGPLSTSISVMKDAESPDSLEPYFKQISNGAGIWHPVSQMPLTEPKVSSVTVSVDTLDVWEDYWLEDHEEHSSPGGSGEPSARYGELPDLGPEVELEEGSDNHLLICCDEVRPCGKAVKLVVKPAAGENGFITVHDYVSAVHPWLARIQEDILNSMGIFQRPVPLATELMVNCSFQGRLLLMENKPAWIRQKRMRWAYLPHNKDLV